MTDFFPTVRDAPLAFHVMAKPTGAICNLDCDYCFYLSKESLYSGSRFRMTPELQETYIRQLLESHQHAEEIIVAWQGGEPTLMGLDFFQRSLELQRRFARPGQRVLNTIQTNGTLIDETWARFFKGNEFLVGISIDGPQEIHDRYRVDKGQRPTFERVMSGLEQLKAHNVDWNVLTCVHAGNAGQGREVYSFLRDSLKARFIQFIPVVERSLSGEASERSYASVTNRSLRAEQFGRFLIDVFEEWVRKDIGVVYVQMFDTSLARWCGLPGGLCVHDETCGLQVALEHTGDLYSCDHFVEPQFRLGNIRETHMLKLVSSTQQRRFGLAKRDMLTEYCRACEVRFACNGGCPKDRFGVSPDGEASHNVLCASYLALFRHIDAPMRAMRELIATGAPPARLMSEYAAADRKRGRNESCTCGSGRKWKQCHGGPCRLSRRSGDLVDSMGPETAR